MQPVASPAGNSFSTFTAEEPGLRERSHRHECQLSEYPYT